MEFDSTAAHCIHNGENTGNKEDRRKTLIINVWPKGQPPEGAIRWRGCVDDWEIELQEDEWEIPEEENLPKTKWDDGIIFAYATHQLHFPWPRVVPNEFKVFKLKNARSIGLYDTEPMSKTYKAYKKYKSELSELRGE